MKTKDQIKQEFMQDLKSLLEKYDAKISAEEYRDVALTQLRSFKKNAMTLVKPFLNNVKLTPGCGLNLPIFNTLTY